MTGWETGAWKAPEFGDRRWCWQFDASGILCIRNSPRHNGLCEFHEQYPGTIPEPPVRMSLSRKRF